MIWVDVVTLLALLEYFFFIFQVSRARTRYGIRAPATTGNEVFERYFRVQQNTVESLIMFLPSMWLAVRYWYPTYVAAIGAVFVIGRLIYSFTYVSDPKKRTLGMMLSTLPIVVFWIIAGFGIVRALMAG
ncbi:MAG: MAPEG family protein [Rudaea sp.]